MKRTGAGVLLLVGGLSGCVSPDSGVTPGAKPFGSSSPPKEIPGFTTPSGAGVQYEERAQAPDGSSTGYTRVVGRRSASGGCADGGCGPTAGGYGSGMMPSPTTSGFRNMIGHGGGIVPVPAMGVPGAVAAIGANGPDSGMYSGVYQGGRTSIRFVDPRGMKITWRQPDGNYPESGLEAPSRYSFPQMAVYGLRLSGIARQPGKQYYPTLEVYPATQQTVTYLSHCAVPISFTDEDFDQANAGSLVVKVIYLPSERFQDLAAVAGAEEVVSTRLDPGVNPVEEANKRGTILAVVRLGNIDLQDPNTPPPYAPVAPGMGGMTGGPTPPSMMPGAPTPPMTRPVPGMTMPTPGTSTPPAPLPSGTTPGSVRVPPRTPGLPSFN